MFFTRLSTVVAWFALIVGALRLGSGLYVGSIDDTQLRAIAAARYAVLSSPGTAINQGAIAIGIALTLGILCEISRAVRR
jgi:hypothetical protein